MTIPVPGPHATGDADLRTERGLDRLVDFLGSSPVLWLLRRRA
ncbi:MAG: hypothetical protein ABWX82_05825 [Leifsonia sp.]